MKVDIHTTKEHIDRIIEYCNQNGIWITEPTVEVAITALWHYEYKTGKQIDPLWMTLRVKKIRELAGQPLDSRDALNFTKMLLENNRNMAYTSTGGTYIQGTTIVEIESGSEYEIQKYINSDDILKEIVTIW